MAKHIEENIKHSFKSVKADINRFEKDLEKTKDLLILQNKLIIQIFNELKEKDSLTPQTPLFFGSTGNKGVKQANKQTSTKHLSTDFSELGAIPPEFEEETKHISTTDQALKQIEEKPTKVLKYPLSDYKLNINKTFKRLSKQELRTFLAVYQQEEEGHEITYFSIAQDLNITESCIRGYIASLLKKQAPIQKIKLNNKKVILRINPDFRQLNLKNKLVSLFYEIDPYQTRLFDVF